MKKVLPWPGGLIALLIYIRCSRMVGVADVDVDRIHAENDARARLRAAAIRLARL